MIMNKGYIIRFSFYRNRVYNTSYDLTSKTFRDVSYAKLRLSQIGAPQIKENEYDLKLSISIYALL
jgi:hypothetical protein